MSDRLSRTSPAPRRWLVLLTTIALLATVLGVVPAPVTAAAAEVVAFNNTFKSNTVNGTGTVTKPTSPSGTNQACLTASGNTSTAPLLSCSGTTDAAGSGALRLTAATGSQIGSVFGSAGFSTTSGLEVSFNSYQYGGGGADGIGFVLAAANPTTPVPPTAVGSGGGSLGYSAQGTTPGVTNGYLGVGLDVYGNFSSPSYQGSGCTNPTNISAATAGAMVVRGPGSGTTGYCGLTTTYDGTSASRLTLRASTRAASVVPVKVLVNPTTAAFTSSDGASVPAGSYRVIATPVGGTAKTLTGTLPVAPSTLYPSSTWLNANGVPRQLSFGFVGSTGGTSDVHEITDVQVRTFEPDPAVSVSTTAYAPTTAAAGDPVTYVARTTVSGAPVTSQITVTHTTPVGVLPLAAYANGFTCGVPSGRTITCVSTGSSFSVGSSSPDITIVAIATATITAATIRTSSTTTATATGATSGSDTSMGTGTLPTAPAAVAVSPTLGSTAGGNTVTVTGSNIIAATAVEIGTTAQMQAGAPVTLLTCASGDTSSCFVVSGSNLLVYMPSRSSSATVSITVVTRGVAGADSYVYAAKPSIPAQPTATAGITSAVVDWVAPAANGSPITGYTVTPYLGTTAQTPISVAGTTTSLTLTGLTAGGSYTFTVAATNAIATSNASNKSTAVVPYDVPAAPTIGSVVAADLAVTLSWTAPSSNGSAITGYVVTPYIGTTAQSAQTFASTATSQSITGLTAGTAYTFTVAARNAAGTGPASASSASATPNAQPTLTFDTPPAGYLGVAYSTQLAATGGTSPFVWSISSGTLPTGLTLNASTGLLSGTPTVSGSYTFTIQVVDASNQSATRAVTLVVTGAPAAPAQPTATAGLNQATVSWVAPSSNGNTITGYVLTPYLGGVAQTPITVDGNSTSRVVGGLTAGGSYTFTVAAVNGRGTSPASTASAAVVPYAALSAPTITAVRAGDSSAVLTWTAPSSTGGSPITAYVVTPYIGSVAQTPQTFAGTATTQTITGLTPGTAYTFQVAAQNGSGATSLYRVNAGGPTVTALDGGLDWAADNTSSSPYYATGTGTTANDPSAALDSTIPAGTPLALFDTQRYDLSGGTNMLWQFPVNAGANVKVRLYFANRYTGTGQVGQRVFDVSLDGTTVLDHFDAVAAAGGDQTATMREFTLTSDGSVDIGFTPEVENPMISAIDIIQTGQGGTGPPSAASAAVTPNASPTLTFAAPPSGEVNVPYSNQLVVTGGTSPFVWSVITGSLPAGLTLNASSGLLSGTPTAAGSYAFTVQVVDASGQSASKAVTLVVAAAPVLTFAPAAGEVAVAYSQQPTVTGGTAPYAWKISAGSLPAGVTLNASTGLISGTPTASGTFSVTLTVTDSFGVSASKPASIVIAALPTLTFPAPPAGQVAVAYSTTFTAAGGTTPLVWSISAGSVPSGLTLNTSTGVLSGTPTTVGSSSFTVSVTDANNKSASKAVTLVVATGPLVIAKTANASSTLAGGVVAFTITLTNTGTAAFTGVALNDPLASPGSVLDDAAYNGDATSSSGTVSYAGGTVSWSGDVPVNGSVTITYSVTVNNPSTGNQVLASTVVSSTSGTNCASGSTDARCTATVSVAGVSIVKSANATTTTPGSVVRFTIVVRNTGGAAVTGATLTDQLAGVLDDATYNADGSATAGLLSSGSQQLTWTGNLAVGATVTITYSVTVADPDTGNRSLAATVVSATAGSTCPSGAPAASCTTTVQVLVPALAISNAASSTTTTPGAPVTYTQTLSNNGQTPYTGISVTLALTGALDDATYASASASSGSVVYSATAGTVVWTGNLAVGAAVTVTESLTVLDPATGDRSAVTTATSSAAGSTCPAGTSNAACTATVSVLVPALTIAQTTDVSSTTPGGVVRYTVSLTNSGQTAYTGATFSESLSGVNATGVLDDATYNADASASSGTVSYSVPTLSWTGDLAVGATATITYSVKVRSPDPGDLSLVSTVVSSTPFSTCPAGGTDSRCTSTVAVLIPALSVSTTVDPASSTTPGGVVRYLVSVKNTGQTTYAGASLLLDFGGVLDDARYNNDAVTSTGSFVSRADGTSSWVVTLAPGQSATATSSFTVFDPTPTSGANKVLTSTVASDAAGSSCPTGSTAAACKTSILVLTPALTITKTASTSSVVTGGTVGYTVLVANTGETTYGAASFKDDLARVLTDATYSGNATATTGAVSYAGSVLSWTGSLAPGASATVSYSVVVRDPDPGDKRMTNTVVSTAVRNNCPAGSTDPRCTAVVNVLVPQLTIAKVADRATTAPGEKVAFTVTVTNSGAVAYTGATFNDALSGTLDDAVYAGDAAATSGSVTLAGSALSWTGDLAVGAKATVSYSVTVNAADVGDDLVTDTVTSTTKGSSCAVGSTDPRCSVTVPVARLVLTQTYDEDTTTPGSVVHARGTFANTGQVPYTGLKIYIVGDANDDGVSNGDQTVSSGTIVIAPPEVYWTGDIPVGGTVTGSGTITINNPDTGDRVISASLRSEAPGNNCPAGTTDSRCGDSLRVLVPGLTMTKTASTTSATPGQTVGYTITIRNSGDTPYTAATVTDALNGVLDDGSYAADAATTTGSVSYAGSTLTWTGDLAAGGTTTITYSVTVHNVLSGDKVMTNAVESGVSGSSCPPGGGGDASCRSTVIVLTPALTILQRADQDNATLGSPVQYSITVTNTGQVSYPSSAFSESLAGVLDDATYTPSETTATRGVVSYANGVLSWSGPLEPGASATIRFSVTINAPSSGDRSLTSTVTSSTPGSNCATGSADAGCSTTVSVTNAVTLTFTKTADVRSTAPGATVTQTVTVVNSSQTEVVGANFTDSLAGVVDDASYNDDAAASSGTVARSGANLQWSGDVAALSTVTVTYSVTVNAAVTGDQILDGTLTSTSLPSSNNCVLGSGDARCSTRVAVARLLIQQADPGATTTPGSVVHTSVTFTNTGQEPFFGITLSTPGADLLDDAYSNGDLTASSGSLVVNPTAASWTGSIPVGGVVTITGSLTVLSPATGNRSIVSTWQSDAPGNNCPVGGSDPRCSTEVTVLIPQLTITTRASTSYVVPGGTVGQTVTIRNSGESPYTGAVVSDSLAGLLDDATYDGNAVATIGTVSFASPVLTWTGDLAVGATATVSFSVTTFSPPPGDKVAVNQVSSSTVGSTCQPASGSSSCRSTVLVLTPALSISSRASQTTAAPGDRVTFTLTVSNTGQTAYAPATLTVPLDGVLDDATYSAGDATATTGTVGVNGQTLAWSGSLAPGSTATITYSVLVRSSTTGDSRLTQTVSSANPGSTCPAGSACTTSVAVAGLRIVNSVDATTTQPTSVLHHTGTFTNTGQVPYVGITIYDSFAGTLDSATYNGDAAATSGSVTIVVGSGQVSWTGDLAVGQTVTVTASLTVNNPATGDDHLTTLITTDASGSNCPAAGTDPACATDVTLLRPQLSVTKTVSTATSTPGATATATPGATIGYTITAANTGQTAYAGAQVRDDLTSALTSASLGAVQTTRGSISTTDQVLTWVGDLGVGEQVVITYTLTVHDPDDGGGSVGNAVTSDEIGSSCPTGGGAEACSTLVTVLHPALDVSASADQTSTTPGSTVGYTILVRNTGETDYASTSVTADLSGVLDDAAYANDATVTGDGTVTYGEGALTWTGELARGATATISYHVTVADPDAGNRSLVTSVSSAAAGTTCSTASPCTNTIQVLRPGLAVSTTASAATATPGDPVTFTIKISNTGETAYVDTSVSTDLVGVVDDAAFDGEIRSSSGTTSYVGTRLTWTGSLAVGQTALVSYTVVVRPAASLSPGRVLETRVLSDVPGSTCRTGAELDVSCTASVSVLIPALTITKSADTTTTTPGGRVGYTISITNSGQTAYSGAVVSDSLSGLLSETAYGADATVTTGGGVVTYANSTLTWTGDLLVGATATITFSLTVDNPYVGDRALSNSVVSSAAGSSCPTAGSSQPGCTSMVQVLMPALGVTQTANKTTVVAGDTVTYTVTLTNTGETDYVPATFSDSLASPRILAFADYANDAKADVGSVSYTNQTLVWSGPLLKGETAVVTFSVRTRYPAPAPVNGARLMTNVVTSSTAGSTCVTGTRARCRTTVSVLQPALSITKVADTSQVVAGGTLGYTITATNTGEADYSTATFTDDLNGLLARAPYRDDVTASAGAVSYAGGVVSWSGPLARGATVQVSFSLRVRVETPDDVTLMNRVVSSTVGSTCLADSADNSGCVTFTSIAPRSITLSSLTPSFTLTGLPGSTVEKDGAVGMAVTTNSTGGYGVTVRSRKEALTAPGTSDTIPIERLSVRSPELNRFVQMTGPSKAPVTVHTSTGPTSSEGDAISDDYQVVIPDVDSGTYSTELEYIATAQ